MMRSWISILRKEIANHFLPIPGRGRARFAPWERGDECSLFRHAVRCFAVTQKLVRRKENFPGGSCGLWVSVFSEAPRSEAPGVTSGREGERRAKTGALNCAIRAIFTAFRAEIGPFSGLFRPGFVGRFLRVYAFNPLYMSDLSGYIIYKRNVRKCCVFPPREISLFAWGKS
jgi:hypothetical protein